MSQERAIFNVTGDVEAEIIRKSVELFEDKQGNRVEFVVDLDGAVEIDNVFTIETALAVATLLSVLFKLSVDIYERVNRFKWDKIKFLKAIEQEMRGQGIQDFTIGKIVNFGCLQGEGDCPCEVTVLSKTSTKGYKVLMFRDGKVFTFEVAYHLGL
jgi:hypothetical protein